MKIRFNERIAKQKSDESTADFADDYEDTDDEVGESETFRVTDMDFAAHPHFEDVGLH